MTPPRLALGLLAIVFALGTLYLGTTDLHQGDRNCGTALLRVDTSVLSTETGDLSADQFRQEALIGDCDQLILRQRFLAGIPAAAATACVLIGRRLRDRPSPLHGDIFGTAR